jgi:hypothetical protein
VPFKDGKHPGGRPRNPDGKRGRKRAELAELPKMEMEARARIMARTQLMLTPDLIDGLVEGMRAGNYAEVLARRAGVAPSTYASWVRSGEERWESGEFCTADDPMGLCVELYLRIDQADAEWESTMVESMNKLIRDGGYWAGHMTFLQRRHPERWDTLGRGQVGAKGWEELLDELRTDRQARLASGKSDEPETVESTAVEIE